MTVKDPVMGGMGRGGRGGGGAAGLTNYGYGFYGAGYGYGDPYRNATCYLQLLFLYSCKNNTVSLYIDCSDSKS